MRRVAVALVGGVLLFASPEPRVAAQGSPCQADTRLAPGTRRREAIVRARNVRERQNRERAARSRYATAAELNLPQRENGFEVTLLTTADGYMLFIRDTTDPCSRGIYADQTGVLYDAKPIG